MPDLSRVSERDRLKSRREPHWMRLERGCFLGYRPSAKGGPGTWIARAFDPDLNKYRLNALGSFGQHPGRDRFGFAKHAAERFAGEVDRGSITDLKLETVEEACRHFAASHSEAEGRFRRFV